MKYYTVRKGKKIWIFTSREETQPLVVGFPDAKYKSFPSPSEAEEALKQGRENYYQTTPKKNVWKSRKNEDSEEVPFEKNSIAVDAACSGNPWKLEYRGVDLQTGEELFHQHFAMGTNNVGEFLAIVHGLAVTAIQTTQPSAIYTDSKTAMNWVKQGKCKSKLRTEQPDLEVWKAVNRAEKWLQQNGIPYQLLKWKTEDWGEIPADFGRK